MCNLQFKRGSKENLPDYAPSGMPLWCEDTKELYIGTEYGVEKVGRQIKTVNDIAGHATIRLEIDSVNALYMDRNVAFLLPTPDDEGVFHEILVQLVMPTVFSIDLGTTLFLNEEEPDLSKPGEYDLIYEYDVMYQTWSCGVIKKNGHF